MENEMVEFNTTFYFKAKFHQSVSAIHQISITFQNRSSSTRRQDDAPLYQYAARAHDSLRRDRSANVEVQGTSYVNALDYLLKLVLTCFCSGKNIKGQEYLLQILVGQASDTYCTYTTHLPLELLETTKPLLNHCKNLLLQFFQNNMA